MTTGGTIQGIPGKRQLQPDDLLALDIIVDARIAPSGDAVAYVVKRADRVDNTYTTTIQMVSTDGGASRPLAAGNWRDHSPRWSPDGRALAFVSDRSGTAQLYVVAREGGEPRQITSLARGAGSPVWSPDGTRLAFISTEGNGLDDAERARPEGLIRPITRQVYRFDVTGYIDDRFQHLWVVGVDGGEPTQLTWGDQHDLMPAWSPDGRTLAFVTNRENGADTAFSAQVYTISAEPARRRQGADGAVRLSVGTKTAAAPTWSPDGQRIAYIGVREEAPAGANTAVWAVSVGGGAAVNLTPDFDRSPGTALFSDTWTAGDAPPILYWSTAGDTVAFLATDRSRVSLFQARDGVVTPVVGGDRAVYFASASANGDRLAYVAGDFLNPCDLYTCRGDGGGERRLTDLNAELLTRVALVRPEHLPLTSFDGRFPVDAWLIRPVGYDPAKTYPLVQVIHGGPHSTFGQVFFFDMQLWANQGWNVLFINPRATQGYGEAFSVACLGDWGGADWREQEQALDLAIGRGGVDPQRLAVTGLSYGGFMTNWIIGQTDRYKVAVSENSICNLVSFFTTADIGWYWLEGEWGNRPVWENLDFYMAHSPISYVPRIKTPTLLLQAETDYRCPIEQGEQFYTALRAAGVRTEMVRFPGESHAFLSRGKPTSRLQRRLHTLRWFRQYLD